MIRDDDAAALAHQLTTPSTAERPPFLIDGEEARPTLVGGWRDTPGCPGWQKASGAFDRGDGSDTDVAFDVSRHVSGLVLVDFYNTDPFDSASSHTVELADLGSRFVVYPGAGYSLTLGTPQPLDVYAVGYPPNGADRNPAGGFYPDQIYTGQTGSGRNRFLPAYWPLIGAPPASVVTMWAHAYRFVAFQIMRPIERVDGVGLFSPDAWIDPGKFWPKRTLVVGDQDKVLDGYSSNHVALQELAAIYLAGRDPRSYRRMKALATAFIRHDWYCGESGKPDYVGRSKIEMGDNSRMKGRALEACAWAHRCATAAGDTEFATWLAGRAVLLVHRIDVLWGANATPSRTAPDGRHLPEPWDATWCAALIGWGAALCDAFLGTPGARALANRVCDWQEALYAKGLAMGRLGCPKDVPADGDLTRATWFCHWTENPPATDDRFGLATSQWIPAAFDVLGRKDSPLVKALRAAAVHYSPRYAIVDPSAVLP